MESKKNFFKRIGFAKSKINLQKFSAKISNKIIIKK